MCCLIKYKILRFSILFIRPFIIFISLSLFQKEPIQDFSDARHFAASRRQSTNVYVITLIATIKVRTSMTILVRLLLFITLFFREEAKKKEKIKNRTIKKKKSKKK